MNALTLIHCLQVFLIAYLGACWVSFFCVLFYRLRRPDDYTVGEVLMTPSHCEECQSRIRWFALMPIVGFLIARGRCGVCETPIPKKYFFLECVPLLIGASYLAWYYLTA